MSISNKHLVSSFLFLHHYQPPNWSYGDKAKLIHFQSASIKWLVHWAIRSSATFCFQLVATTFVSEQIFVLFGQVSQFVENIADSVELYHYMAERPPFCTPVSQSLFVNENQRKNKSSMSFICFVCGANNQRQKVLSDYTCAHKNKWIRGSSWLRRQRKTRQALLKCD